jgi:hypothetical protein
MALTYGRRTATRVAIATVTGVLAAGALAAPSSADSSEVIAVDPCKKPWTQLCEAIRSSDTAWKTRYQTPSNVWVTADPTHCSDIIVHVRIDGREVGADRLGAGESTLQYKVPAGEHSVRVQAEGVAGGCNRGFLAAWGGTIHFQKLGTPGPIDRPNGE